MSNSIIKVLLVEDDEDDYIITRDLLADLENKKFLLSWVSNYDLALESITYKKFDIIIVDYRLGDRTGLELLQAVQKIASNLPVILLTGQGDYALDTEAMKAGAADYLIKGQINSQLLERSIRYAIERKQSEEALRQSEEKLKAALSASETGTLRWDIQNNSLEWDENLDRLLGYPFGKLKRSRETLLQIIHSEDRKIVIDAVEKCVREGTDLNLEFRIVLPDGTVRWISDKEKMFFDDQGSPLYMTGALVDITSRKHTEAEREQLLIRERKARAESEAANRIKDEFLAVLSHELRTPINLVLGWSRLLRGKKYDEATTNRALETIERNAKLQTQLIEDLLDVSRILRGKLSLNVSPVNLGTIIEAAMETVSLAAEVKGIKVQAQIEPNIQVLGDPNRLQQVVWNLLSNAVKFTAPSGNIEVSLSVSKKEIKKEEITESVISINNTYRTLREYAEIQIKDTGKGIQSDFLPYVFDSFRQADSTSTRAFGGLGLGLAIVKHLVELHGGTVIAASAGEDRGSTFTVKLPTTTAPVKASPTNGQGESMLSLSGLHILVVDDETDSRELITFMLECYGAEVQAVSSAQEALDILNHSPQDLLLSDIGMPDMDGYMLIREVRSLLSEQVSKIPAIALTAYASETDAQKALAAGFHHHISKPIEPYTLVSLVVQLTSPSMAQDSSEF